MSSPSTINLIRTRTSATPEYGAIERSLRKSAYAGLIVFVSAGIIAGVVFSLLTLQERRLEEAHTRGYRRVTTAKKKEGILLSIKDRTRIVSGVMATQKPWATMLDRLMSVIPSAHLKEISIDQQNKISLTVSASSIDELVPVVDGLISLANDGFIRFPQLVSLTFGKKGNVEIGISLFSTF